MSIQSHQKPEAAAQIIDRRSNDKIILLLCFVLILGTWLGYRSLCSNGFVTFDDPAYVLRNLHVNSGLSWSGILWAFKAAYASNWHPLTWISHMLDCTWFGLNPAGHHLTSLLLHIANTLLLFAWLRRQTGSLRRSFMVAALFAWHPLHVESVAWISERKDVLSTFFFLLSLLAYCEYARGLASDGNDPASPRPNLIGSLRPILGSHAPWYLLSLLFFSLGLMSKAMLVTLPFVLFLLDFWPLNRLRLSLHHLRSAVPFLVEKIPFLALSLLASITTFVAQHQGGAMSSLQIAPLGVRLANAIISYPRYILKIFCPSDLSIVYPYPDHWPILATLSAGCFLAVVSWLAFMKLGRSSSLWFPVGWFWFLGILVPVIGLVQVGPQAMADRYTYIPSIGLFILLIWGVADLLSRLDSVSLKLPLMWSRYVRWLLASLVSCACLICTTRQVAYWKTGETLFAHAIQTTKNNYAAWDGLGSALCDAGKVEQGLQAYIKAIELAPGYAQSRFNLGTVYLQLSRYTNAVEQLRMAATLNPGSADIQHSLGTAYFRTGNLEEAMLCLQRSIHLQPDDPEAHHTLGLVLLNASKPAEAAAEFASTIDLNPRHAQARRNMGVALAQLGHISEAADQFGQAVRLSPADPELRFNLGLALMDLGRPADAMSQFSEAVRLNPTDPKNHYRLALAAEQVHRFGEAIAHYQEAVRLYPNFPQALNELAWVLATNPDPALRSGAKAVTFAEKAYFLTQSSNAPILLTLAAAYAESGRLEDALTTANKARDLAQKTGETNCLPTLATLTAAFESGRAYHQDL